MNDAKLRRKALLTLKTDLMKQNVTLDYACTKPNSSETRGERRTEKKGTRTPGRESFFLVCARRRKAAALNRQHDSH